MKEERERVEQEEQKTKSMKKMATRLRGFAKSRTEKTPEGSGQKSDALLQLHHKMTFMNGKQIEKAGAIKEAGQNIVVLVSMNKETMKELVHQLSPHEGYVEIDKLRKIVYDEQIIDHMAEEDFQDYRARLFHTNLTFFDKAIEKSKNNSVSNLSEIWHAKEIHNNFMSLQNQLKSLNKKLKTVQLFMECVKPEAIEVNKEKLTIPKYDYMKMEANKVVERWKKKQAEKKRQEEEERKEQMEQEEAHQRF